MIARIFSIVCKLLLPCLPFCYIGAAGTAQPAVTSKLAEVYNVARLRQPALMKAAAEELGRCKQAFEQCGFFVAKPQKNLNRYFQEKKFVDGAWAVDIYYHPEKLVAKGSVTGRKRLFGYIAAFFCLLKHDPFFPYARERKLRFPVQKDTQAKYMLWSNVQQALEDDTVYSALLMYLLGLYRFLTEPKWPEILTKAKTTVKQEVGAYNTYWHKNMEKGKIVFQAAFGLITAYDAGTPLYYTQQPVNDPKLWQVNRTNEPLPSKHQLWGVSKQYYASCISRLLAQDKHELTGYLFRPLGLTQGARAELDSSFLALSWSTFPWAERISAYWFRTGQGKGLFPQVLYTQIAAYVGRFPYEAHPGYPSLQTPPDTRQWRMFTHNALYSEKCFLSVDMMYERLRLQAPWDVKRKQQGYSNKSCKTGATVTLSNAVISNIMDKHYYLPLHRSNSEGYAWLQFRTNCSSDILVAADLSKAGGFIKLRKSIYGEL